jgi:translation initiation factor 2D
MFKKPFVVQTTAKVKGSELKKIKAKVLKDYELTEEELDAVLPDKGSVKLQLDNKSFLYAGPDNVPAFIDADGRGNITPSLFTLWAHPKMAKTISIFAPVSPFVCKKGADVMLPGCAPENLGTFAPGNVRALLVSDPDDASRINPMPIAIGEMDLSSDDDHGMKGRAMRVVHYYGDEVWQFGGGTVGEPNAGFKEDCVEVFEGSSADEAAAARADRLEKMDGGDGDDDGDGGEEEFSGKKKKKKDKKKDKSEETEEERAARKAKKAEKKKKKEAEAEGSESAATRPMTPGDHPITPAAGAAEPEPSVDASGHGMSMDELIEYCFTAAIVQSLDDDELPAMFSQFYSQHMIKYCPAGEKLDFKKSGWKKIAKFCKDMSKKKLIVVKEKQGEPWIESVDRSHKIFKAFKPVLDENDDDAADVGGGGGGSTSKVDHIVISEVWKPDSAVLPIFAAVHGAVDKTTMFSIEDANETLAKYIAQNSLGVDGSTTTVKLDEKLVDGLFKGFGRKKGASDDDLPKEGEIKDMQDRMKKRLLEYHTITGLPGGPVTKKGHVPAVRLEENRAHGHNVTLVSGLETYGLDMDDLAQNFKKKLMCTTSTQLMPGKTNKNKEVVIQGHHKDPVLAELTGLYGIPEKYIQVTQKK